MTGHSYLANFWDSTLARATNIRDGDLADNYGPTTTDQRKLTTFYFEAAASWRTVVMKVSVARVRVRSRR